ncbi:hypothetical protein PTTG_29996 [Puccinia triticina 1-1 BBBD Race 1]|uniref:DUF659 domain-containing protein n=1 Tax=Puccinia triticina (isolate 1-1 / race 1 (BBBD)) TaxID=630390 RepID=A0A180G358_PUCT1|nr:hypothetical protein PTTG_29996 [Puccinia triticina 1-1 BBBD Race 1]
MVSRDIHMLYSAVQENYRSVLQAHTGALYLGVDGWQSPNGFDILGIVIYCLAQAADKDSDPILKAMPLDFICLSQSHTGEYLSETVRMVVEKFGIQQKIWGIVSDNASNNKVMVRELKKFKWPRFKGETQWLCCFAHVLNLIVQAILRLFGTQKKPKSSIQSTTSDANDSNQSVLSNDNAAERIRLFNHESTPAENDDEDIQSKLESINGNNADDTESLGLDDIDHTSNEDNSDRYTTDGCKQSLAKFRAIAKKLKYSLNSKDEFRDICQEKGCATPHTVECDVRTRWNSTLLQLQSIIRCKPTIHEWQRHKRHGVHQKYYLDQSDFELACDLVKVLNPLQEKLYKLLAVEMQELKASFASCKNQVLVDSMHIV